MDSAGEHAHDDEIVTSMNAIVDLSEKWSQYIKTREERVRIVKALISGALIFLVTSAVIVTYVLMHNPPFDFFRHREIQEGVVVAAIAGLAGGIAVYLVIGRGKDKDLEELKGFIAQLKKSGEDRSGTESALSVTEKILVLLPKVVRKRSNDALTFGIAAFILASVVGSPGIGILVGFIVWLYFRYESNQDYERQVSRLEEQKRAFEQGKKRFVESL